MTDQIFEANGERYVYRFDALPISHKLTIQEIYHFKFQQLKRNPATLDQLASSGGMEFFTRACGYLLLPIGKDDEVQREKINPKKASTFVGNLTGEANLQRLEECMKDFFERRGMSELESNVRSRDFITLAELTQLGLQINTSNSNESETQKSAISPSEENFSAQES